MSVRSTTRAPALESFDLGPGEHAALSLALELGEGLVLLDDAAARAAANALKLSTTGTLGILLLAKERGLIVAVAPVLAELERHGFRITEAVRSRILQLAGEERHQPRSRRASLLRLMPSARAAADWLLPARSRIARA